MIDNYTIIMWINPIEECLEDQAERIYKTLVEISKIETLRPQYLTAKSKKSAKEFILTKENIYELILKKQDKLFPDLGSILSFFTSMNDDEMNGIRISTGITNTKFINSIVIDINSSDLFVDDEKLLQIIPVFKKIVELNNPFYACIVDRGNESLYDGYFNNEKQKPKTVYWMNYWGKDIISRTGFEQAYKNGDLKEIHEVEEYEGGYFLNLTKESTDFENEKHMAIQESVNLMLKL